MADGGLRAPHPPPAAPVKPAAPIVPPTQPPAPPAQPVVPPVQPIAPSVQPGPVPQLNLYHFKLEVAGKPDKDAEAQLLMTNDWMDTYAFLEGAKV